MGTDRRHVGVRLFGVVGAEAGEDVQRLLPVLAGLFGLVERRACSGWLSVRLAWARPSWARTWSVGCWRSVASVSAC
jgi:hypothetical protein